MNKKFITLLTTGALLVTSFAAVGCASKRAVLKETTPATRIQETKPAETEETLVISPVSHTEQVIETETLEMITPVTGTKKVTKKASKKTVRKTVKKSKKVTKKTSKKTSKKKTSKTTKTTKSSNTAKFTYGRSEYNYKSTSLYINIKKDNTFELTVLERHYMDKELQYEIYWNAEGTVDPKTNTGSYKNGIKQMIVMTNTGKNSRMQDYGGKGTIKFNGSTLKWNNNVDHIGNDYTFVKR